MDAEMTRMLLICAGPKGYNSPPTQEEFGGSTPLHLDMTDALNILLSALCKQPCTDQSMSQKPLALWDIFPAGSCEGLRQYLRGQTGDDTGDPIHNQETYLTTAMLKDLEGLGIVPWRFEQREGDIVYIPAGCPHQVNLC